MTSDLPELSVVIPAYNESQRIRETIESVSSYLTQLGVNHEIIIVDDGSSDSTAHIVRQYAQKDGRIRLITYQPNRGKGFAVRTGMLAARSQSVLLSDADMATPIEDLEKLERAAQDGFAVVVGSRALEGSVIVGWRPWYRELSGIVFNKIVRLLAVPKIHDTQCGFKLFTNGSGRRIFSVARVNGFGFDVEALFLASKFGYRIGEIAVHWNNSPATKVRVLKHTLPMVCEVIRVRINDWMKRYESPRSEN
ncbi:MAG: glycosyltransferase family 2 protein [Candidatus Abyssobacteria bacterium SURF_17]|jgi:dolichyl-phosphate beta-glucosyltransferase|uniref:dolichyl-phosphate beta-glucosyltransferase n=1 Tax=Candidatus Abyssobacteria bacterium SURF_17 TaxID=2093361 RepID=A0A419F0B8_9BACT|nr:MAG: glycosyltransferase family 2 protein [Candidatus Abyssubacteria bacterium SURF_17]